MTDTTILPRGLRIAAAWLDQIRTATGIEPDQATVERIRADCFRDRRCRDCAALIGRPHEHGCDVENCQWTGIQWIQCGGYTDNPLCRCADDENYDEDGYTIHTCGQSPHDCGSQIWDGVWPGYAECVEYGWYSYFAPPWRQCGPEHPQAGPDLNRLRFDCDWDRERRRWVTREPRQRPLVVIVMPPGDEGTQP